ncbi:MAG: pyridoxamine kinase [Clostridiales bacterium]|nr:pyridoxamine kinase [Clostridiales bacterium]
MQKKVAVFNDISGLGRCSLSVLMPVISALGVHVCPIPTAVLTNQTGYDSYYICDCTENIPHYAEEWKKINFVPDGIYTGFFSSTQQIDSTERFIADFRNSDTLVVVDPIMADHGRIYDTFSLALCERIKKLALKSNITTPNLTEFSIISGMDYNEIIGMQNDPDYIDRICGAGKRLLNDSLKTIIVTGIPMPVSKGQEQKLCNLVINENGSFSAENVAFGSYYSGTGDIFSSIICGCLLQGCNIEMSVDLAVDFISKAIEGSCKNGVPGNSGTEFEPHLGILTDFYRKEILHHDI